MKTKNFFTVRDSETGNYVIYNGNSFVVARQAILDSIEEDELNDEEVVEFDLLCNGEYLWRGNVDALSDLEGFDVKGLILAEDEDLIEEGGAIIGFSSFEECRETAERYGFKPSFLVMHAGARTYENIGTAYSCIDVEDILTDNYRVEEDGNELVITEEGCDKVERIAKETMAFYHDGKMYRIGIEY